MAKKKAAASVAPDLSYIAEGLRPLAVPVADLVFDQRNAKMHAERDLSAIAASLRKYGVRTPAVVRRADRRILKGNGSLQAAIEKLKWTHYPVLYVDDDENTATGYALADNRTSELAEWDLERVGELLDEINFGDDDLDVMRSEFQAEIDELASEGAAEASRIAQGGADPAEKKQRGSGGTRPQGPPSESWQIVVTCTDEAHQTELLQKFEAEGLQCRATVT